MRADKITHLAQSTERKARDVHHRKRRGARLGHPSGQQGSATVWAIHYKMDHARMNKTSNDRHLLSGKRMMRIFDDNNIEVFLGSMSLVRAAWARAGSPALSATRRAEKTCPSSTPAPQELFADLAIAHGDARYARLLRSLARVRAPHRA